MVPAFPAIVKSLFQIYSPMKTGIVTSGERARYVYPAAPLDLALNIMELNIKYFF